MTNHRERRDEIALQAFPVVEVNYGTGDANSMDRYLFMKGYDQAVEDMQKEIEKLHLAYEDEVDVQAVEIYQLRTALESIHKAYKEHDEPMTASQMWKIADEALKEGK